MIAVNFAKHFNAAVTKLLAGNKHKFNKILIEEYSPDERFQIEYFLTLSNLSSVISVIIQEKKNNDINIIKDLIRLNDEQLLHSVIFELVKYKKIPSLIVSDILYYTKYDGIDKFICAFFESADFGGEAAALFINKIGDHEKRSFYINNMIDIFNICNPATINYGSFNNIKLMVSYGLDYNKPPYIDFEYIKYINDSKKNICDIVKLLLDNYLYLDIQNIICEYVNI